jgi:hypothetical protein
VSRDDQLGPKRNTKKKNEGSGMTSCQQEFWRLTPQRYEYPYGKERKEKKLEKKKKKKKEGGVEVE